MRTILFILFTFLLASCGPEMNNERNYNYTIINNSGRQVKMIPYVEGQKELQNAIVIDNNKSINKKITAYAGSGGLMMVSFFNKTGLGITTHIEIVFENQKKIIYEECSTTIDCNANPRNIFGQNYMDELIETYIITPEDYQNATDCGGSCY